MTQQWRPESRSMTFDEVSVESSKSFVKALQELKNLRPQLYSAAEYCEKSYLQSEQKQMVLDNLKDYAVRALVNAIDHLGTVAYKLTDLFEQQILDISTVERKLSYLKQQSHTCQAYGNKEGLIQLQVTARTLRHHKHYTLPNSHSECQQSNLQVPPNGNVDPFQGKSYQHASGKSASKPLAWLLASEVNSAPNGASLRAPSSTDAQTSRVNPEFFHLLVAEELAEPLPPSSHLEADGNGTSDTISDKFGLMGPAKTSKPASVFKSFDGPSGRDVRPHARSKKVFSAFFTKGKNLKLRKVSMS